MTLKMHALFPIPEIACNIEMKKLMGNRYEIFRKKLNLQYLYQVPLCGTSTVSQIHLKEYSTPQ